MVPGSTDRVTLQAKRLRMCREGGDPAVRGSGWTGPEHLRGSRAFQPRRASGQMAGEQLRKGPVRVRCHGLGAPMQCKTAASSATGVLEDEPPVPVGWDPDPVPLKHVVQGVPWSCGTASPDPIGPLPGPGSDLRRFPPPGQIPPVSTPELKYRASLSPSFAPGVGGKSSGLPVRMRPTVALGDPDPLVCRSRAHQVNPRRCTGPPFRPRGSRQAGAWPRCGISFERLRVQDGLGIELPRADLLAGGGIPHGADQLLPRSPGGLRPD